ncbi:unnamed protein product, partial [Allacma fusca]
QQDRILNDLELKVSQNRETIQNLTRRFNTAMDNLALHQKDYAEFKGKWLYSTYAIAYVTTIIMLGKTIVQEAARQWEQGKVDPALLDYFNISIPCGKRCPIHLARAQSCTSNVDGTKVQL